MTRLPLENLARIQNLCGSSSSMTMIIWEYSHASEYLGPVENPSGACQNSRTHTEPMWQLQLHDLHPSTTQLVSSQDSPAFRSFVTPGDPKLHDATASRRKLQQIYGAVVKPLLKHKSQVSHKIGPELVRSCTVVW